VALLCVDPAAAPTEGAEAALRQAFAG